LRRRSPPPAPVPPPPPAPRILSLSRRRCARRTAVPTPAARCRRRPGRTGQTQWTRQPPPCTHRFRQSAAGHRTCWASHFDMTNGVVIDSSLGNNTHNACDVVLRDNTWGAMNTTDERWLELVRKGSVATHARLRYDAHGCRPQEGSQRPEVIGGIQPHNSDNNGASPLAVARTQAVMCATKGWCVVGTEWTRWK
jgi:hypothetical protein